MNASKSRLSGATAKWVLPLVAGFIAVVLLTAVYRRLHPQYPKSVLAVSSDMGMPPWQWLDAQSASQRASMGTFTAVDWQLMRTMWASNNNYQKTYSLSVMAQLYKTEFRSEAINCARSGASNPDPHVRAMSIGALAHLGDATWRDLATQSLNSQDSSLRESARTLLDKNQRSK